MKRFFLFVWLIVGLLFSSCQNKGSANPEEQLRQRAQQLAQQVLIVDTHIDLPYRLWHHPEDVSLRTEKGHFDYPRARQGGLDVAFAAIYIPASYQEKGGGRALADSLIDLVETLVRQHPGKFAMVKSVADVRAQAGNGKILFALGMENGAGIEGKLENLRHFYQRGIRYITLAHSKSNRICDSSYDPDRKWHGLSPFGREVVKEMNRLGIMVDVSHITDEAFYQVMEISQAPVIASHSSCRYFTPGFERNMSDEMIQLLAKRGGVIQISFGSYFVKQEYQAQAEKARKEIAAYLKEHHLSRQDSIGQAYIKKYKAEHPLNYGSVTDLVDHIDHAVKLVGVDHVGLGSDFEGVTGLPEGIRDVSMYPNIIYHLLKRGYSEEDIRKICGENLLRVWSEVEAVAAKLSASS